MTRKFGSVEEQGHIDKQFGKLITFREIRMPPEATAVMHCDRERPFTLCVVLCREILDRESMSHHVVHWFQVMSFI